MPNSNTNLVEDYIKEVRAEGKTQATIDTYLKRLKIVQGHTDKPFEDWTKADVVDFLSYLEKTKYAITTKNGIRITLKAFFKWLRKTDDYPYEVKWVKPKGGAKTKVMPEDLISKEEFDNMMRVADTQQKALLACLGEGGLRRGEAVNLTLGAVIPKKTGGVLLRVSKEGKTGARNVWVIGLAHYINEWLAIHPRRGERDAPFFISTSHRNWHGKLTNTALYLIVKRIAKRAGIKRRIHPHLFRHTRATDLTKHKMDMQLMCKHFGWSDKSDMPMRYAHLSDADLYDFLTEEAGLKPEKEEKSMFSAQECPICKTSNPSDVPTCVNCGASLSIEAAEAQEERVNVEVAKAVKQLLESGEYQKMLQDAAKKKEGNK